MRSKDDDAQHEQDVHKIRKDLEGVEFLRQLSIEPLKKSRMTKAPTNENADVRMAKVVILEDVSCPIVIRVKMSLSSFLRYFSLDSNQISDRLCYVVVVPHV